MLNYEFLGSGGVCPLPNRELTALYVQHQGSIINLTKIIGKE